jgi:hypothetical protein
MSNETGKATEEDAQGYLESLSDDEMRGLPPNVVFFLRDLEEWLAMESGTVAMEYSREIRDMLRRHHDLLILDR